LKIFDSGIVVDIPYKEIRSSKEIEHILEYVVSVELIENVKLLYQLCALRIRVQVYREIVVADRN